MKSRQYLCGPIPYELFQRPRNKWPQLVMYMQMLHGEKGIKKVEPLRGVDDIPCRACPRINSRTLSCST